MLFKGMASVEATKKFCNEVRKAGGGKQIKDLMPSFPTQAHSCLIAKNLNFGCAVGAYGGGGAYHSVDRYNNEVWSMYVSDEELAEKIATKLKLRRDEGEILLPAPIAKVAQAFDEANALLDDHSEFAYDGDGGWNFQGKRTVTGETLGADQKNLIKRFWPYFAKEIKDRYEKPSFV